MALFGNKKIDEDKKKPAAKSTVKKPAAKAAKKDEAKKEEAASMQDLYSGAKAVSGSKKAAVSESKSNEAHRVLVSPLITEKATNLVGENKYVFIVAKNANKIEIAKAIKATYGVKPLNVNVVNVSGKKVARGRVTGQRSDWRKAIVTLAKGDAIKIYEGV